MLPDQFLDEDLPVLLNEWLLAGFRDEVGIGKMRELEAFTVVTDDTLANYKLSGGEWVMVSKYRGLP